MQPDQNQYNFILDPSQPNKKPSALQNPKQRKIMAVIFVAVVVLLVTVIAAVILSSGKQSNKSSVDVAAYQTELLRLTDLGLKSGKSTDVLGKIATLQAFISSDLSATTSRLAKNGTKLSPLQLGSKSSTEADKQLESASARGAFDEVILDVIESTSASYKQSLQTALNESSSPKFKEVLETAAKNILSYENISLD